MTKALWWHQNLILNSKSYAQVVCKPWWWWNGHFSCGIDKPWGTNTKTSEMPLRNVLIHSSQLCFKMSFLLFFLSILLTIYLSTVFQLPCIFPTCLIFLLLLVYPFPTNPMWLSIIYIYTLFLHSTKTFLYIKKRKKQEKLHFPFIF